jgi:hypothetical protein
MVDGLTCSYREDDPLRHPDCAVGDWLDIVGCKDGLVKPGQASPAAERSRLIRGQARTQRPVRSNVSHSPVRCPRRSEAGLIGCLRALREPADRTRVPIGGQVPPAASERVLTCLYREGTGWSVREPEGIETPPPGKSSEKGLVKTLRARHSQCRGRGFESLHLHQKPRSEAKVGSQEDHETVLSATWCVVEVEDESWPHSPKNQVTNRQPDLRHSGMCDWGRVSLRVFTGRLAVR